MDHARGSHKPNGLTSLHAAFALLALLCVAFLSSAVSITSASSSSAAPKPPGLIPSVSPSPTLPDLGKIPIAFEPNAGQAASFVRYVARLNKGLLSFSPSELNMSFSQANGGNTLHVGGTAGSQD